jgi:hypothetical protein
MNKSLLGRVLRPALLGCGLLLVFTAVAGTAQAGGGPPPLGVPEIDLNSAAAAVALLAGGVLVLQGRRKSAS